MARRSPGGAVAAYLIILVALGAPLLVVMATTATQTATNLVAVFMFVPAVSALLAWAVTGQRPRVGRPSIATLLLALVPALLVGVVYAVSLSFGLKFLGVNVEPVSFLGNLVLGTVLAFGEELGWRGYLLPYLRRSRGYLGANLILVLIWFAYHVPVILIPGLYSNEGIPLWASLLFFAIGITGFSFYVGWLWEKSHDVWAPSLAHGFWNQLMQSTYPAMFAGANLWLMGEFGILSSVSMIVLFLAVVPMAARRYRQPLSEF